MISGFDKYFQIVRCFRDEDLRADRQPEFTQIDLEMSYPQPERVWEVVEGFLTAAFKAAGSEIKTPFPRMSYDEAIRLYGSDKPDMRLPAMVDVREAFTAEELEKFAGIQGWPDVAPVLIRIPKAGEMSGTERRTIGTYGAFAPCAGNGVGKFDDRPEPLCQGLSEFARTDSESCGSRAGRLVAAGGAQGRVEADSHSSFS